MTLRNKIDEMREHQLRSEDKGLAIITFSVKEFGGFVAIDTQSGLCNNSAHVSSEPSNGQDSDDEPASISAALRKRGAL